MNTLREAGDGFVLSISPVGPLNVDVGVLRGGGGVAGAGGRRLLDLGLHILAQLAQRPAMLLAIRCISRYVGPAGLDRGAAR